MFPDVYSELLRRRGLLDEDDMATSLPADTWFTEYQGRETEFAREVLGVETKAGNLALWEAPLEEGVPETEWGAKLTDDEYPA